MLSPKCPFELRADVSPWCLLAGYTVSVRCRDLASRGLSARTEKLVPCRSRANLAGWYFNPMRVARCFCSKRMLSSSALTRCSDRSCPHSQHCYTLVTHILPGPTQDTHSCHPARSWCSSWGNWPLRMGRGLLRPGLHFQLSAQDEKYLDIQGCPAHCRQVSAAAHLPGKNS